MVKAGIGPGYRRLTSHYFDPAPPARSSPRDVTLALPDLTARLRTDRGVFSAGRVDPGTKLLLLTVPEPPAGPLCDLGCGYGPVTVALAHRQPAARVWAVDVNARARDLTRHNASALANVTVVAPDEVPADMRFAALYSNPPVRIGKPALYALLEGWVPRADVSWLVVHKHLGSDSLADWMAGRGWSVDRIVSRSGYRVLRVAACGR